MQHPAWLALGIRQEPARPPALPETTSPECGTLPAKLCWRPSRAD